MSIIIVGVGQAEFDGTVALICFFALNILLISYCKHIQIEKNASSKHSALPNQLNIYVRTTGNNWCFNSNNSPHSLLLLQPTLTSLALSQRSA